MMNNPQIFNRTQHPHLFAQNQSEKQNRSKIQLTHIHQVNHLDDKSTYSVVTLPTHIQKSQQPMPQYRERIGHSQQPVQLPQHAQTPIYLLMKEQIEIAAFNYKEKMGQLLKMQAQEIQKLSAVISYNNKIIQKQHQALKKLTQNEDNLSNTGRQRITSREESRNTSKSPNKISLTQKRSSQRSGTPIKPQQIQNEGLSIKIQSLKNSIDQIDRRLKDYSVKNNEIFSKLSDLEIKMTNEVWRKIKTCEEILRRYVSRNQQKLSKIEKTINSKLNEPIIVKLGNFADQIKEFKELMFNLVNRQFNYDSYHLNVLREDHNRINQKINNLANDFFNKDRRVEHFKEDNRAIRYRQSQSNIDIHHNTALTHSYSMGYDEEHYQNLRKNFEHSQSVLERSKLSSLSHHTSKPIIEDRVKHSEQWDLQDHTPDLSDEDEFYYQQEEGGKTDREDKAHKLEKIMKKQGYKFPVKVEVDKTGYLKLFSTGMYILDELDNGFELNFEDLQHLKKKGIVIL